MPGRASSSDIMPSQRVLFVAPVEPWCRENGSSVVISDLLDGLAAVGGPQMFPIFLRGAPPDHSARRPPSIDGLTLGVRGLPRWLSIAGALSSGRSPLRMRFPNGYAARRIVRAVRSGRFLPTLVHVEHLPLVDIGLYLARVFRCPLVYRAHNIESQLWARRLGIEGPLKKWLVRRVARLEADAITACQLTLCISHVDLDWIRTNAPGAKAELLRCGVLLSRYERLMAQAWAPDRQVCFVGGLDWPPNENGLRWFVDEVLPRITSKVPGAKLAVLARGAATRPWAAQNPAVRVVPPSADARSMFAESRVSIAPLLQGGGVRIKILESLAIGCPVVATRIGAEGLELSGLTSTDDPTTFAEVCIRHLSEGPDAHTRSVLSDAVRVKHSAEVVARQLIDFWAMLRPPTRVWAPPAWGPAQERGIRSPSRPGHTA